MINNQLLGKGLLSALLILCAFPATADWRSQVGQSMRSLPSQNLEVYVREPVDASREGSYYPFLRHVQEVLIQKARNNGYTVVNSPTNAKAYLETQFRIGKQSLQLFLSLKDADSRNTIGSATVELASSVLPIDWKDRTLKDIAFELATKLDEQLFGQKLSILIDEFSGGKEKTDAFVSDFSILMRGYIREEVGSLDTFRILIEGSTSAQQYSLRGHYQVLGNEVFLRLKVIKVGSNHAIANASSRFSLGTVPSGVGMFPPNEIQAKESTDEIKSDAISKTTTQTVTVWVNHDDRNYRDGDPLTVSLRPDTDLYVRVYYVQSDGVICQIMPSRSGETGYIRKGYVYEIGGAQDDVELTISDETVGQESIKVFASHGPIDDSNLPKRFISGANVSCLEDNYQKLIETLTRALKMKYRVRPASEVKILVRR